MSYFAAAVVRGEKGWSAAEVDLAGVADIEEVADRLRDVDLDADVSLMFVESDDSYLVILRLDEGEDLRVFGSDAAFAEESRLGTLLLGDVETAVPDLDEVVAEAAEESDTATPVDPVAEPIGDADLLADLRVPAARLLTLCAQEGMLPSDVTAEVCAAIGAGDAVDQLRESV